MVVMTSCVLLCLGVAGCSTIQAETDEDVAGRADYDLPDALRKELDSHGLTSPAERADAAQTWFNETNPPDVNVVDRGLCVVVRGPGFVSTYTGIWSQALCCHLTGANRHPRSRVGFTTWPMG